MVASARNWQHMAIHRGARVEYFIAVISLFKRHEKKWSIWIREQLFVWFSSWNTACGTDLGLLTVQSVFTNAQLSSFYMLWRFAQLMIYYEFILNRIYWNAAHSTYGYSATNLYFLKKSTQLISEAHSLP